MSAFLFDYNIYLTVKSYYKTELTIKLKIKKTIKSKTNAINSKK